MNSFNNSISKTTFSLTTPLYYVNGLPHIGSAYTTMIADVIARWQRLSGNEVLFVTGTDEHGQKIQGTAEDSGVAPQEHCDRIADSFSDLWAKLNIQYDRFSRTTAKNHGVIVKEFFERVYAQNDIYLDQQQGWYCVACEEFKEKRELSEDGYCPIHTNLKAEWRDEQNYFFRLSRYQSALEKLYQSNPDFIQPETRRNEVLNFVKQGLQDFSISRINVSWGFPIPNDPSHTIYVWFDALLGYITALLEENEEPTLENALKKWYPFNLHLIGKDILRFHAVYWPAMLMSANLPLPHQVFGHGFLTKDGHKMGKTLGNTLDPFILLDKYGSDAVRYYFLKEIEFGKDGDFNETRFVNILNADLANDLGNLLNRSLGMLNKYCGGILPPILGKNIPDENTVKQIANVITYRFPESYKSYKFDLVCEDALSLVRSCNKFIDDSAPWSLYKKGEQKEVEKILYILLESVRFSAFILAPIIPNISNKIYNQLGYNLDFNQKDLDLKKGTDKNHFEWGILPLNQNLPKPNPVFIKLELPNLIDKG
ncbi:MAG: methionine--tRNA ligase [Cyanobacteria bacterium]|nr:methionine--tRNA ligase [Cyanobacteria bacterium CG_2015-16_32_12]NCO79336.1 methionine--tRNA ligase [Cyanobacteria bacterium CG_2015-22_32_23]NCQ04569.1 methionine--tRNA ligase [Cyanobacteria bacterium CG_2015-09_32_10]NCQ41360.1 methionine--tRNA ligase [Cyanobacteria bacterium CG_2015-04_32_10]NCS84720.1 methionine--tRNA ligase [Cyanobacteria bacterium CG_2015-02_32_10]